MTQVMIEALEDMFSDPYKTFKTEMPNDPTVKNASAEPTICIHKKNRRKKTEPNPAVSNTFIQMKIVENTIYSMPSNATINVDKLYELKLKKLCDVNKLSSRKEILLIISSENQSKLTTVQHKTALLSIMRWKKSRKRTRMKSCRSQPSGYLECAIPKKKFA